MDFAKAMKISAAGMTAQSTRLRVIAENLANANSLSDLPGGVPYRRKTVTFANELDRALDAEVVQVKRIGHDRSPFSRRYEPTHPAADAEGYVLVPNVKSLVEMMDMREAERSYDANLRLIEVARGMAMRTLDLLR